MVPFGKVTVTVAPGTPVPLTTVSLLLTGATLARTPVQVPILAQEPIPALALTQVQEPTQVAAATPVAAATLAPEQILVQEAILVQELTLDQGKF